MTSLEYIRGLPDGTKSRVIQAAHRIAQRKLSEAHGGRYKSEHASEAILFYDDDTWQLALGAIEAEDDLARKHGNALDSVLRLIADAQKHGKDTYRLHEERIDLTRKGMKPTIEPFCYRCDSKDVTAFGMLCLKCQKERR